MKILSIGKELKLPMHVGLFTLYYQAGDYSGGLPTLTSQLALSLLKAGHNVTIITRGRSEKIDVQLIDPSLDGGHVVTLPSLRRISAIPVTDKPGTTNGEIQAAIANELNQVQSQGHISQKRPIDVVEALDGHRRAPEVAGALFQTQQDRLCCPIVLSVHTIKDIAGWSAIVRSHPWASVVVVDPGHIDDLKRYGVSSTADKPVFVRPLGVNLERFSPNAEPDMELLDLANCDKEIIGELGARLVPDKGPDIALQAFSLIHRTRPHTVLLLGQRPPSASHDEGARREDQMRQTIGEISTREGLVSGMDFRLVSYPPEDMPGVLRAIAASGGCLLAPCRKETFGMLPIEAAACGVPVVASDVSGHRLTLGAAGIPLVEMDTAAPQRFAQATLPLLSDGPQRESAVRAGLEMASNHSLGKVAVDRVDLYQQAILHAPKRDV